MSLLSTLTNKPWEQGVATVPSQQDPSRVRRVGLRVLLAVISMLFFLFLVAFLMRSQYPDWQPLAEEPGHPLFNPKALWLNSFYLLMASVFVQWAKVAARKGADTSMRLTLSIGGAFSMAFVAGQFLFWQHLYAQGHVVNDNPALSFFYLLTGLHAAHVFVGLLLWLLALAKAFRSGPKYSEYIGLCASYWHFLLVLWGLLFALLTSKPETYDAIAAFCGLR